MDGNEEVRAIQNVPEKRDLELVAIPAVESIPGKVSGTWILKGTAYPSQ